MGEHLQLALHFNNLCFLLFKVCGGLPDELGVIDIGPDGDHSAKMIMMILLVKEFQSTATVPIKAAKQQRERY